MNLEQYAIRLLVEAWDAYPDPTGILAAALPIDELALENQVTVVADVAGSLLGLLQRAQSVSPQSRRVISNYMRTLRALAQEAPIGN